MVTQEFQIIAYYCTSFTHWNTKKRTSLDPEPRPLVEVIGEEKPNKQERPVTVISTGAWIVEYGQNHLVEISRNDVGWLRLEVHKMHLVEGIQRGEGVGSEVVLMP